LPETSTCRRHLGAKVTGVADRNGSPQTVLILHINNTRRPATIELYTIQIYYVYCIIVFRTSPVRSTLQLCENTYSLKVASATWHIYSARSVL